MPETPPALRGALYSTHLFQRCYEYHPCRRCMQCTHFNRHNAMCVACESVKPGQHHECKPHQVEGIVRLEELLGRPMFDINAEPGNVTTTVCDTSSDENSRLVREINDGAETPDF